MDSLRKSFKSHGSYKHQRSSSRSPSLDRDLEDQPILFDHHDPSSAPSSGAEVVVSIDGNSSTATNNNGPDLKPIWREDRYDFWRNADSGAPDLSPGPPDGPPGGGGGGGDFSFPPHHHPPPRPPTPEIPDDPPSRLISSFINKQKAAGVEASLDMDLEMDELKKPTTPSSATVSKDLRVSFQDPTSAKTLRRRNPPYGDASDDSSSSEGSSENDPGHPSRVRPTSAGVNATGNGINGGEVLKCTSTSLRRTSTLMRTRTRSRLMDPPPLRPSSAAAADLDGRLPSGPLRAPSMSRSGLLRSGLLGKPSSTQAEEEDDDPFAGEDIPDEVHRRRADILTILEWVSLVVILGAFGCSLAVPALERQTLWNLHLWKWEVLVLVLICGRLVSGWVVHLVVFFFERNFLLRKRVLYFVYGVRKAVRNCIWLGLVLLAWHYLFDKKVERETRSKTLPYVTKVLVCLLIANAFRLLKTLLVKVLASSFHVSTYFDRIQESLFNQYVFETLSGPPLIDSAREDEEEKVLAEVQRLQNAGATVPPDLRAAMLMSKSGRMANGSKRVMMQRSSEMGKSVRFSRCITRKDLNSKPLQQDEGITIDHLHKLNQKNVSAWNMKRLMNIVRHGGLSTLDEQITHAGREDDSALQIRSEYEAKAAAKKIFTNVAKPGAKYIYLVDLMHFMREDEAIKTFSLFDGAQEAKRVSRSSLKNWVVNAFRERRALSLTLNDTKTAVKKLHQMVNVVVGIIVLVIWLLILGLASSHVLVLLSSQLLLAAFIFGNTCKTTFEAIIFLFVMHPFDVGDRCEVDGVQMIVEEMNILTTIFLRFDGLKITYPNSVLATKLIANFYRSPDMGDAIDFCIHVSTPVEKVALMKDRIKGYIESKVEHWYPSPMVVLRDIDDLNKLRISIWLQHRMNHQDMGERWSRREHVVQEMIRVFRELDIEYRMLPCDVNVRNMPGMTSTRLPSTWLTCS